MFSLAMQYNDEDRFTDCVNITTTLFFVSHWGNFYTSPGPFTKSSRTAILNSTQMYAVEVSSGSVLVATYNPCAP